MTTTLSLIGRQAVGDAFQDGTPIAPTRIQLSRKEGFCLQEHSRALNGLGCVQVDRTTKWGNPFSRALAEEHGQCGCNMCCVVRFESALSDSGKQMIRDGLGGKNVACWCRLDQPCHGDILLMIANGWTDPVMPLAPKTGPSDTLLREDEA